MKKVALVLLALGLVPLRASAVPPVVGAGGVAVASREAAVAVCSAQVVIQVTELTVDTIPAQVRGKAIATGKGLCEGSGVVPYATDVHLYLGDRELSRTTCWDGWVCSSPETAFVSLGQVLTAVSDQWWDTTLAWNAATPGLCLIHNPQVWCMAKAVLPV
ncbi:MAG: hypothetical protein HY775_06455 [Acidobacteria bacterium]|nr:hypothetical protein [Acidobacteriota bacterium]